MVTTCAEAGPHLLLLLLLLLLLFPGLSLDLPGLCYCISLLNHCYVLITSFAKIIQLLLNRLKRTIAGSKQRLAITLQCCFGLCLKDSTSIH